MNVFLKYVPEVAQAKQAHVFNSRSSKSAIMLEEIVISWCVQLPVICDKHTDIAGNTKLMLAYY